MTTCTPTLMKEGIHQGLKYKMYYAAVVSGDTGIVVATGLHQILNHGISPPSVASKYVTKQVVSDGTITYTITDPEADEYFYIFAESDT